MPWDKTTIREGMLTDEERARRWGGIWETITEAAWGFLVMIAFWGLTYLLALWTRLP